MVSYLGIDIAKRSFQVTLLQADERQQAAFSNDQPGFTALTAWLAEQGGPRVHACLEATGRYGLALATALFEAGHQVSVVNPAQIKAFAQVTLTRSKTDPLDATLLARFCQLHQPRLWCPPDPARERLRQLTRYQQALQQQQQSERNRLQAGAVDPLVAALIQAHLAQLETLLADVAGAIAAHIAAHPALQAQHRLLDSIPGIGPKTATVLLAELPDIRRFQRASQLVAFAGVDPQLHVSGTSVRKRSHISKRGNAHLRKALFFPAMSAKTHSRFFHPFVQRLQASQHCPMSIIVAVMRKQLQLIFGVLKHQQPFDPHYLEKKALAA